jgi:hypothetical protein
MGRKRIEEGDRVVVVKDEPGMWTRAAIGMTALVLDVSRGACPEGGRYNDALVRPDDHPEDEMRLALNRLKRLL